MRQEAERALWLITFIMFGTCMLYVGMAFDTKMHIAGLMVAQIIYIQRWTKNKTVKMIAQCVIAAGIVGYVLNDIGWTREVSIVAWLVATYWGDSDGPKWWKKLKAKLAPPKPVPVALRGSNA